MTKIKLNIEFIKRYRSFLTSPSYKNYEAISKSIYWKHHSKLIKAEIKNDIIDLDGLSGNYIPPKKNSFDFYYREFKNLIKKLIFYKSNKDLSYANAFKKIFENENQKFRQCLSFRKDKILAKNISECKKKYPFNYSVSDHVIRSYYYLNILNSYIDLDKKLNVIEIGGGSGNLMSLIKYHFETNCIVNIDLPETLSLSIPFIKDLFPKSNILLPNEIEKLEKIQLDKFDFIFCTPSQINKIDENLGDLIINTASFQEMQMDQIKIYLDRIQKIAKKDSYFFCTNSVEKLPVDGKLNDIETEKINPTRFFEYPFLNNEIIIYQLCKFTSLVQRDPAYLRLEKIKK